MGSRNPSGWLVVKGDEIVAIENTRAGAHETAKMLRLFTNDRYVVRKGS